MSVSKNILNGLLFFICGTVYAQQYQVNFTVTGTYININNPDFKNIERTTVSLESSLDNALLATNSSNSGSLLITGKAININLVSRSYWYEYGVVVTDCTEEENISISLNDCDSYSLTNYATICGTSVSISFTIKPYLTFTYSPMPSNVCSDGSIAISTSAGWAHTIGI